MKHDFEPWGECDAEPGSVPLYQYKCKHCDLCAFNEHVLDLHDHEDMQYRTPMLKQFPDCETVIVVKIMAS